MSPEPTSESRTHNSRHEVRRSHQVLNLIERFGVLGVWAVMIAVFGMMRPYLISTQTLTTTLSSQAVLVVLSMGLMVAMSGGYFDLSLAGVMGLSLVICGHVTATRTVATGWAILIALGVAALIGVVHSILIVRLQLNAIVVTLGTGALASGIALAIEPSATVGVSPGLVTAMSTRVLEISAIFWYALLLAFLLWYVQEYTPLGRKIRFIAASPDVARLAGIRVHRLQVLVLVAASTLAGAAGVAAVGYLGVSSPTVSGSYLLPAFAAVLLSLTIIKPGEVNVWGVVVATYFLVTGPVGLSALGYGGWETQVFYGGSLLLAVIASGIRVGR
jgi:ribose transport system permease protein